MDRDFTPEGHESKYCVNCGSKIDKNAEICPGCGVRQPLNQTAKTIPKSKEDKDALSFVQRGALALIISVILIFIIRLDISVFEFSPIGDMYSFGSITLIPGLAFLFYANINFRKSFSIYYKNEPESFRIALSLSKLLYVGTIIMAIGLAVGFAVSASVYNAGPPYAPSTITPLILVVMVGAILSVLGYIGIIIGLFRIATKFNDMLMEIGVILFIIPFASIIGAILIFVTAKAITDKMASPQ